MHDDRWRMLGRIASVPLAAALVFAAHAARGPWFAWRFGMLALVALACIWFSEAVGSVAGDRLWRLHPPVNGPTPGCIVAFAGWMLLLLPLLAMLIA